VTLEIRHSRRHCSVCQHGIQRRGQDFGKNNFCSVYGEKLAILNTDNIKFVDE